MDDLAVQLLWAKGGGGDFLSVFPGRSVGEKLAGYGLDERDEQNTARHGWVVFWPHSSAVQIPPGPLLGGNKAMASRQPILIDSLTIA